MTHAGAIFGVVWSTNENILNVLRMRNESLYAHGD